MGYDKKMSVCFTKFQDQVYAILNWKLRDPAENSGNTGLVLRKLDTEQLKQFEQSQQAGNTDSSIFECLFPRGADLKSVVRENQPLLTREKLVELINKKMDSSLQTLWYMSTEDLTKLLEHLERLEIASD